MARYPAIFRINNAKKNSNRKNVQQNFHASIQKSSFPFIKHDDPLRSISIKKELPFNMPFELLENSGDLVYSKIIQGCREEKYWIFQVDSRNSFNHFIEQEISVIDKRLSDAKQEMLHVKIFSLDYLCYLGHINVTYNYYLIFFPEELLFFIEKFSKWLCGIDFSLDQ